MKIFISISSRSLIVWAILALSCEWWLLSVEGQNNAAQPPLPPGQQQDHQQDTCRIYLGPSLIPNAGRGVFAGIDYTPDSTVEEGVTLTVHAEHLELTQLAYYHFASQNRNFQSLVLGPGSFINHDHDPNVAFQVWAAENTVLPEQSSYFPYTETASELFFPLKNIAAGEEFHIFYGENWFQSKLGEDNTKVESGEDAAKAKPKLSSFDGYVCMSDVVIGPSTIQGAGRGLFARRAFKKGELITVAPTAALDKVVVEYTEFTSLLMNYCLTRPQTDLVFLPMGHGAMINHHWNRKNVELAWYDLSSGQHCKEGLACANYLEKEVHELVDHHQLHFDLAYYAYDDIAAGAELFIDYGEEWEHEFKFWLQENPACEQQLRSEEVDQESEEEQECGHFRSFITAPSNLYSKHWYYGANAHQQTQESQQHHQEVVEGVSASGY